MVKIAPKAMFSLKFHHDLELLGRNFNPFFILSASFFCLPLRFTAMCKRYNVLNKVIHTDEDSAIAQAVSQLAQEVNQ